MTDYSKLVEALRHVGIHQDCNECEAGRWHNEFDCCLFKDAADAIEALQAQLPKRGEWKKISQHEDGTSDYECSACLGIIEDVPDDDERQLVAYCPMCGAKMEVQDGQ